MSQLFGCCRVVFNDALAYCQEQYRAGNKKPSSGELSKRLTELKKTEEKEWLTEVSSVPLQQSLRDLEQAYSNFLNPVKDREKARKLNPLSLKNVNLSNQLDLPTMGLNSILTLITFTWLK